jgi:hypothetical protein
MIEIIQVFGSLFLGIGTSKRDDLESKVDKLSLDVPITILAS